MHDESEVYRITAGNTSRSVAAASRRLSSVIVTALLRSYLRQLKPPADGELWHVRGGGDYHHHNNSNNKGKTQAGGTE